MANSNTVGFGLIAAGTIGSTPATQGQGKYYIEAAGALRPLVMSHNEIILSIQFQNILVMYGKTCMGDSLCLQSSYSTHGAPKLLIWTFYNSLWRNLLMSFYELCPKTVLWSPKTSSKITDSI